MLTDINIRRITNEMPLAYIRFYTVGLLLYLFPFTRSLFISIITPSLLLVFASVFILDRNRTAGVCLWCVFIVISSFLLELLGVATGGIFGEYAYGRGLVPLVGGTPLIIGINWLFLIYATHMVANRTCRRPAGRVMCGSLLMVLYDVIAEWVAPLMQMWQFGQGYPPLRNFAVWFAAALVYHTGFEFFPLRNDNPSARILFAIQIVFFVLIGLFSQIM